MNVGFTTSECIIRQRNGQLLFVGQPWDGRHVAVQRCNEGKATDTDFDMLADLPVLDEQPLVEIV